MTEESALLAAIRANPDDDMPRLVYADWLEENGEGDRSIFIRTQIEISNRLQPIYVNDSVECFGCWRHRTQYFKFTGVEFEITEATAQYPFDFSQPTLPIQTHDQ
jgi:uncharacterized protein (TIGR02996 family)